MLRVGEVTNSQHVIRARDVHIATNKDKILLILYSSKTHGKGNRPQKIKITANRDDKKGHYVHRHFCPFKLLRRYIKLRGSYMTDAEPLFIFRNNMPVSPDQARAMLKNTLRNLNLDCRSYGMHSFRIGRTTDLIKYNYSMDEVKRLGRWKSNVIFKYIRD